MSYEVVAVVGFGVALAATSIFLFCAHVKRINAPNKTDPSGTLVTIDLADALAKDEAARRRRAVAKGHNMSGCGRGTCGPLPSGKGKGGTACGILPTHRESSRCSAPSGESGACSSEEVSEQVASPASRCAVVLPSPVWAEGFLKHADVKRKRLRSIIKAGESAAAWETVWARLPPPRRRRLLTSVRAELVHAVSSYVGRDEALFDILCPELRVVPLEAEYRGTTGFARLVRWCLDGKVPEPRSRAYAAVRDALALAAVKDATPKDKQRLLRAFLPTFRKLCSYSLCIGVLDEIVSGRADWPAGPTLGSVCAALVKTGGSGLLIWAFFHGLSQMSASNTTELHTPGLAPAAGGGEGLLSQ